MDEIVVVGSGGQPYREYAFEALAGRFRVSALLAAEPTWQRPYLAEWAVADLGNEVGVVEALSTLTGRGAGVLTWDETALEMTAAAAEKLSLRHMSRAGAAHCRDKHDTRRLLAEAGLNPVRHALVHTPDEAVRWASGVGFPVVVKPRALAGSIGVAFAQDADAVRAAFTLAENAEFATLPTGHGVLVEEYLDGPEISVDSVVDDGVVTCVQVARKRLGFDPYFEEVGHLVAPWTDEPWADEVRELVVAAHTALGVDLGVTHAEVRLTARGPRLVELNGRLGGDLIPYVGVLAGGTDLVVAAAELALGHRPRVSPELERCAEVRFVYPPHDSVVREVDLGAAAAVPGIAHTTALVAPGATLRLPPRQVIPRLAALVATGAGQAECAVALDAAEAAVVSTVDPLVDA